MYMNCNSITHSQPPANNQHKGKKKRWENALSVMMTRVHHRLLGQCSGCKSIGGKVYNANTFIADNDAFCIGDERVWCWGLTRLALGPNTFGAGDERVWRWRRTHLVLETNAFIVGDEGV